MPERTPVAITVDTREGLSYLNDILIPKNSNYGKVDGFPDFIFFPTRVETQINGEPITFFTHQTQESIFRLIDRPEFTIKVIGESGESQVLALKKQVVQAIGIKLLDGLPNNHGDCANWLHGVVGEDMEIYENNIQVEPKELKGGDIFKFIYPKIECYGCAHVGMALEAGIGISKIGGEKASETLVADIESMCQFYQAWIPDHSSIRVNRDTKVSGRP